MSVDIIRKAHEATEEGFLSIVAKQWPIKPQLAVVGSYCLTGLICDGKRAVLGRIVRATGEVLAMQLSAEHNASIESVRQELHSLHPDDSQIVILKHNVWRVKGLIQSLGGCNRCQMINLNYQEGEVKRLNEPLATLAAYRRVKGKIFFGILLRYDDGKEEASSLIQVGEEVYPVEDLL